MSGTGNAMHSGTIVANSQQNTGILTPAHSIFDIVRQFIAIVIAAAIFMAVTPARELLKLPHLVAHYMEHVQQDGESFGEYLSAHYKHKLPGQGDEHQDKGCLPFQSDHHTAPSAGLGLFDRTTASTHVQVPIIASVTMMPLAEDALLSTALPGIFQPPRLGRAEAPASDVRALPFGRRRRSSFNLQIPRS